MTYWLNVYEDDEGVYVGAGQHKSRRSAIKTAADLTVADVRCLYRLKVTLKPTP